MIKSQSCTSSVLVAKCAFIFFALSVITIVWFSPFSYHAIMGDDLNAILSSQQGGFASSFLTAFSHAPANKYRPFTDILFRAEILMFGNDMLHYIYFNIVLEIVNASLLSYVCWRLSHRKTSVALLGGILFIVSRFAYYNILQIFGGPLEGLALFFVLLQVCMVVLAYQAKKPIYLFLSAMSYLGAIFTHERYMVMGAFIFFSIILAPINYRRGFTKYYLASLPILILFLNFAIKVFWLKSRFFEGGGGKAISFSLSQFLEFYRNGLLNLFGFNVGPQYLSGLDVSETGFWGMALGSFFCLSVIALILYFRFGKVNIDQGREVTSGKILFLFCTLLLPLMAAASITFRQEYRWLYAPYAVFIIAICWGLGGLKSRIAQFTFISLLLFSAVSLQIFYRQFNGNIYFFAAMNTAESAKNIIVEGLQKQPKNKIFFFHATENTKWIFQEDYFFKYYSNNPNAHINCISNITDIQNGNVDMDNIFVYTLGSSREVMDVTGKAKYYVANVR